MDAMGEERKGPGRPAIELTTEDPKEINLAQLEWLAERQYSRAEMAAFFRCDVKTLGKFTDVITQAKARGQGTIRDMIWQAAGRSDKVLLHMARHYLGQHEKQITMTNEQLAEEIEKRLGGRDDKTDV